MTSNNDAKESKIDNIAQQIVDGYNNNPDIRNSILQIHILGPVIDYAITTLSHDLNNKRFMQTIQVIQEEMLRINETMIDFPYTKDEEFIDNLRRAIEYSIKAKDKEKIRWYCRILIGSVLKENVNERRSTGDFLIFILELTLTDILVGREIYGRQKDLPKSDISSNENTELKNVVEKGKWHDIRKDLNLTEEDFDISLTKLTRAGFIKEIVGTYIGYAGRHYLITPAFKRLMKLIQYANEPTFNYKIK